MRRFLLALFACALAAPAAHAAAPQGEGLRFAVRFPAQAAPFTGRLLVLISTDDGAEPRFQVTDGPRSQQVFGIDVADLAGGADAIVGGDVLGYPLESLRDLRPGTYNVQALLHRYETFHRADGHVVQLPMDRGEGQQWNRAPGNLYGAPRKVALDPAHPQSIALTLEQ